MTQEQKDLLLRDLCARLPYGVKGMVSRRDHNNRECEFVKTIDGKLYDRFAVLQESWYDNVTIKPYLFPLSSMTDEQIFQSPFGYATMDTIRQDDSWSTITIGCKEYNDIVEWLNKNHFDYRGLIPMGLAIDAINKDIY